ncbi:hypothetical protein AVEN_168855-1 [Araneus ventricosus]|uniref:Uncharacterized protein n=1 Tax=Araneus ventricosus TaxID=182803 RepID=A0A4Y2MRN0_ARAVE|nr:hypothetical protein AVEN_168855-1 [Araneus ventricosus]
MVLRTFFYSIAGTVCQNTRHFNFQRSRNYVYAFIKKYGDGPVLLHATLSAVPGRLTKISSPPPFQPISLLSFLPVKKFRSPLKRKSHDFFYHTQIRLAASNRPPLKIFPRFSNFRRKVQGCVQLLTMARL